jgi:methyl-accepting chemotaxis protein
MTTKIKICVGFVLMILLLSLMSVIGYRALGNTLTLLLNYTRIVSLDLVASDLIIAATNSALELEKFLRYNEPKYMDSSIAELQKASAKTTEGLTLTIRKEQTDRLNELKGIMARYVDGLQELKRNQQNFNDIYSKQITPEVRALITDVAQLGEAAIAIDNLEVLKLNNGLWNRLNSINDLLTRFEVDSTPENAEKLEQEMNAFMKLSSDVTANLRTEKGMRIAANIKSVFDKFRQQFSQSKDLAITAQKLIYQTYEWDIRITQLVQDLNKQATGDRAEISQAVTDATSASKAQLLGISMGGIIVGLLFAVFIVFSLIRILHRVILYAEAVASGNLEYQSGITEKGEIGAMVQAMEKIPAALKSILEEYQTLATRIENGALNSQCDAGKYHGGFATMIRGTNDIISRLNTVVDSIPSPVLMLDKNQVTAYLNTAGRQLVGDDYKGKSCKQLFDSEDSGTASDGLRKAADSLRPASGETRAHPRGQNMDISYTAIPMLDKNNKLASILQLIVDLTPIKQVQRTIQNVAQQAVSISDRVAAASEELAAQVEEVSRGAETQRSRVESTASAMTEMNSTVLEVARNASQASEQSELTRSKANDGAELVNQVVKSINLVNKVAATLQGNMKELGGQAESIGGVMNVISDIADQTNLLALNAAIEAARAGEAGRGFAVVADEVRKLAEKTMSATQEVGANITAIQHSTRININEVGEAAKAITEATNLANSSGQALTEIVNLATANSSVVTSIATAAEEQSATSEEINQSIEEINSIVGQTTDGMMQASAAVQELSQMAQELNRVVAELK